MIKHRIYIFLLVLGGCIDLKAVNIKKGFEALHIYNYFKAKEIFDKTIRKQPIPSAFGLSIIYSRSDNPFTNIDSANRYILLCNFAYEQATLKTKKKYLLYGISETAIDSLKKGISKKAFDLYKNMNSIVEWNTFIEAYQWSPLCFIAIDLRDSIVYYITKQTNSFLAYEEFIKNYPFSKYASDAKQRYELTLFQSTTSGNTIKEYEHFLIRYPDSPFKDDAENAIYKLSVLHGTIPEFYNFIRKYPKNHNVETAWRAIYSLYTVNYNTSIIENFIKEFPDYPFIETINTDIILSAKKVYAIRENDKWGFMDSTGTVEIAYKYEWVDYFQKDWPSVDFMISLVLLIKRGK